MVGDPAEARAGSRPASPSRANRAGTPTRFFAETSSSPFRLTLFSDIATEHHKEWLIDDLLAAGEVSCWYGYPGSAKSALVGDGAAHVGSARPWFDRPVRHGVVLYIAAERSALVKRRLAAWRKYHGVDAVALGVLDGGAFDLFTSLAHADCIIAHGLELAAHYGLPVVWVIIDTKAQVMGGANPNDDTDVMALNDAVKHIQRGLGTPHVTLIDHVPLSSPERMKGSGAFGGVVDASFLIKREGRVGSMKIGSKPPNDGPEELNLAFVLQSVDLGTNANSKVTTAPVVIPVLGGPTETKRSTTPLPADARKVYRAYGRLVDAGNTYEPPNVSGVRPTAKAVKLADLRDQTYRLGLLSDPEPSDPNERSKWLSKRRQAWKRALDRADYAGVLRREDDLVWDPRSGVTDRNLDRD